MADQLREAPRELFWTLILYKLVLANLCLNGSHLLVRLSVLSFPVRKSMSDAIGCDVLGVRDPKRAAQLVGNCMAFSNAAVVQLVALSCFTTAMPQPQ